MLLLIIWFFIVDVSLYLVILMIILYERIKLKGNMLKNILMLILYFCLIDSKFGVGGLYLELLNFNL